MCFVQRLKIFGNSRAITAICLKWNNQIHTLITHFLHYKPYEKQSKNEEKRQISTVY